MHLLDHRPYGSIAEVFRPGVGLLRGVNTPGVYGPCGSSGRAYGPVYLSPWA